MANLKKKKKKKKPVQLKAPAPVNLPITGVRAKVTGFLFEGKSLTPADLTPKFFEDISDYLLYSSTFETLSKATKTKLRQVFKAIDSKGVQGYWGVFIRFIDCMEDFPANIFLEKLFNFSNLTEYLINRSANFKNAFVNALEKNRLEATVESNRSKPLDSPQSEISEEPRTPEFSSV